VALSFCKHFKLGASVMNLRSVEKLSAIIVSIAVTIWMNLQLSLLGWNKKALIFWNNSFMYHFYVYGNEIVGDETTQFYLGKNVEDSIYLRALIWLHTFLLTLKN
jgi:hypothetical protein